MPTSASRRGIAAWTKGSVLRLSSKNKNLEDWCTDCYVTILVDVVDEGRYEVMARSNLGVSNLWEGKKVDDLVYHNSQVCYIYNIRDASKDIQIRTTEYSGIVSILVNPKVAPESYQNATYKTVSSSSNILTVSARERQADGNATGQYYICVFGHITATYSIQVDEMRPNLAYKFLDDGFVENDEIVGES